MRYPTTRHVRGLLVAMPLTLAVSCGAVNGSNRPEPVAPLPPVAAGSVAPLTIPEPTPKAKPSTAPPSSPKAQARPPEQIDPSVVESAAAKVEPNTVLGAVVVDRVAGSIPLSVNLQRQFRSASLVKLLIAIDVLDRGATAGDRERLVDMIVLSDDNIASSYWVEGGRPDIIDRTATMLGLKDTMPPEDPGRWGEVLLSPADVARIYRYILDMPPADRSLLIRAMGAASRVAADGFDQYFGIPDGLQAQWAIKQGWGNNSTTMALHSTGLVGENWRYIVVLLTEHPRGVGWQTSADSVTAAAAALHGHLPGV
jgi:hypothetical protein